MKKLLLAITGLLLISCVRQPSRSHPGKMEWLWIGNAEVH